MPHLGRLHPRLLRPFAHRGGREGSRLARFMMLPSPLMSLFYVSIWHSGYSVHLI